MQTRHNWRAFWAASLAFVLAVAGLTATALPAAAAEGDPEYLQISKTVDKEAVSLGEPFTYTINVTCSEASCLNAALDDALPAELAGYSIQNVFMQASATGVTRDVTWTVDGVDSDTAPTVATADTRLHVDFTQDVIAPPGQGLENGVTFTVTITLQVPNDLKPGITPITNTANTVADNAAPVSDSATITVQVPKEIKVATTKAWGPSPQSFNPGAASTIDLTAQNTSNGPIETLVLQEPQAAADGDPGLDPSNPFTITDFTGFSGDTLPEGATAVQVDVFVQRADGTWEWATGPPAATATLPDGIAPGDVGGIRLTYTGEAIAQNATGTISFDVEQRETHRNTDADLSTTEHVVDNVVAATGIVEGMAPVTSTAEAKYRVVPASIATSVTKSIAPNRIAAGDSAAAVITGNNTSDVGVNELRISDLDYFSDGVKFGGFTELPTWPADAASATLIWHPLDGSAAVEVPFVQGVTPDAPGFDISGFELVFIAEDAGIQPLASSTLRFTIDTDEDATGEEAQLETVNTVTSTVTAPNGNDATDEATAPLVLVTPAIDVTLEKTIRPSTPVAPGENVVTELRSNLRTTSDYVTANQLVIEDALTGDGTFWDAFNLSSIASTQVPSNTAVTIEVQLGDGSWAQLTVFPAQGEPSIISMSTDEIIAALPAGTAIDDVTGIRFNFDNPDGFASNTTVTPYVISTARSELRSGGAVVPGADQPVAYENAATTTGVGVTDGGTPLTGEVGDVGQATIQTEDGTGPGVDIDKRWLNASIDAQSDQQRTTRLSWRVSGNSYDTVTISDAATPPGSNADAPIDTVYDAFDLVRINAIATNATPYSNGWYMKYDNVVAVQLFNAVDGAWADVAVPAGGWSQGGAFVGLELSADQRANSTGMRIVLEENADARTAATQQGPAYDPFAPIPGSGVAVSSALRTLDLTWQIRATKRSDGSWVTQNALYNTGAAGEVNNTTDIVGVRGTESDRAVDDATIVIRDQDPAVKVAKSATPTTPLYVPRAGTDASSYPTATFSLQAENDSVAKASYVRVTDPPSCSDSAPASECESAGTAAGALADPFTADIDWLTADGQGNPFNRFDLTSLTIGASIAAQIDLAQSTVWLLHYDADADTFSTSKTTAADANTMTREELADVVGVSVTFQGSDPAITGGTISFDNELNIVMDAQLRTHLRVLDADGNPVAQIVDANVNVTVPNRVFAQAYDPILNDDVTTGDQADASVVITGGDLNVAPTKSVTPGALTEPTRNDPVTVTIGANSGNDPVSTLAPAEVRLQDDIESSPDFWNQFDFTALGDIVAPNGSDRVQVGVYGPFGEDGELEWVDSASTPFGEAAVPVAADQYSDIQGVRVAFSREDGGFFSAVFPAPAWTTSTAFTVQLREEYRDSGDELELAGSVENEVTVISDRLNGESSEAKAAAASVGLSLGTFQIAVNKLANGGNHFAQAGQLVPWDLTFRNTGTGYLTVTELRDALPTHLVFLGDEPVYTPQDGGLLPTPESIEFDGDDLVFSWADGSRMAPGESFGIRILLELQPGLRTGQQAVNEITVAVNETLEQCTNTVAGSGTTGAWDADKSTCGTTDYVSPSDATNLYVVKGVRGEREGAINPFQPALVCAQNLQATGGSYYRTPCAANSIIGGTDDWVLRAQNGGTTLIPEMVIFDQFPVVGDRSLISGSGRGSSYRPQLLDTLVINAPANTATVIEVTTSADVCVGTWLNLVNQEPCAQNGEVWEVAGDDTDWSTVSGLRVSLDFRGTAQGALAPGELVDVTYSTTNLPATEANPSGAPSAVPADDVFAWNQFGVKYLDSRSGRFSKISPSNVGVHLLFGSIQIDKTVTGPAASYAAGEFRADVVCTIEGATLDMGDHAVVELNETNGFSQRIDGIPLGAGCEVTEQGEIGEFGEVDRTGTPATLDVVLESAADVDVPAAQVATITNDYQFSGLAVAKIVETDAEAGEFGPFDFTLACTSLSGFPVLFEDDATELAFTLEGGDTFTAPADTIPAHATCAIAEVGSAANGIAIVGTDVTDNGDGTASVIVGASEAEVFFTNTYDTALLTVAKVVDGPAAEWGTGPFGFTAVCTYFDQTLLDLEFALDPNTTRTFGPYPTGTSCVIEETDSAEATHTAIDPVDGTVVLGADDAAEAVVTATNTFGVGAIQVEKSVTGPAAAFAATEFLVDVVCTIQGTTLDLGENAVLELNGDNSFTGRVDGIPLRASCAVTEQGEIGQFGEIDRTGTPATISVDVETSADERIPSTQISEIANDYQFSGLEVTKNVETDAVAGEFGPFDFTLTCTSSMGYPVLFDGDAAELAFTIEGGETFTAPADTIPANSTCAIVEVGSSAANGIAVAGTGVTDNGDGAASVIVGSEVAEIVYTNTYGTAQLIVSKVVDGPAAEWGTGPFDFAAVCTYGDQTLLDEAFALEPNAQRSFGPYPTGTSCAVSETDSAGATHTAIDPADGIIVLGENGTAEAVVTATNTFGVGAIRIDKTVTGPAANFAAAEFLVDVVCTVEGTGYDLGENSIVELNGANGFSQRIDGIPLRALCAVTEQGEIGEYGEVDRTGTPATISVETETAADAEIPATQIAAISNDYQFSGLSVTKQVDTDAAAGEFGPFDFTLECTSAMGIPVLFAEDAASLTFTIEGGETFTVPADTIPANANCLISEVGSSAANSIAVVGTGVTDNGDGTASVVVGTTPAEVTYTNSYDTAQLTVSKVVEGSGATLWGNGPFGFTAVCTYEGQTLLDDAFDLDANSTRSFGPYPTGTSCVVDETDAGGATSTVLAPEDGTVVLGDGDADAATVTATNTFLVGAIQIDKALTGPATDYAADEIRFDVVCTIDGAAVVIGEHDVVELNAANGFGQRIDGLPLGTSCEITEQGATGEFGETSRSGSPVTVDVTTETVPGVVVPASNTASFSNDYQFTDLSITKKVDTDATGEFGPFDFALTCTSTLGIPVTFDGGVTELRFSIAGGDTYTVGENTIPANSACALAEIDSASASEITMVGTGVTDNGDGTASIALGTLPGEVIITNSFDSAILTVVKTTDGEGAALWGTGAFGFGAVCTYEGQTLLEDSFELEADAQRTFGPFPTGTSCAVEETDAGGATSTILDPQDGTVVLTGEEGIPATVSAVNTFDVTSIDVTKAVTGDLDADGAQGSFLVELVCVWPASGSEERIAVPGGAERELRAGAMTTTYTMLPVGAQCTITETETGDPLRTEITVTDADGAVTVDGVTAEIDLAKGAAIDVRITNEFVKGLPATGLAFSITLGVLVALLIGAGIVFVLIARRRTQSQA